MPDHNARAKRHIYHTIYRLNLSFVNIVANCYVLLESGILKPNSAGLYRAFAQELQAQINQDLMSSLEHVESRDLRRFGKVRETWEKELRDPNDVFLNTEEQRKDLASKRKQKRGSKRRVVRNK